MAMLFDKIGKEAKDLLGKGMDTDKKFTFSKAAMTGLTFSSETVDTGSLETTGSFKLEDPSGMDVTYEYAKTDTGPGYSFESNFDLNKLADVDGVTVTLSGDNKNSVKGSVEYKSKSAAVTLGGGKDKGSTEFPFSVGLAPVAGVNVGISGTVKPDFKTEQLYESATVAYSQKGVFGASAHLTKNLTKYEVRGFYDGLASARVGLKVADVLGSRSVTVGGQYTIDEETAVKAVVADNGSKLKAGVTKTLGPGCKLTVGYAVGVADIAVLSKHKCGFVLDVE